MLSHRLGELWADRGVPGRSALGSWLSVVLVAVAGVQLRRQLLMLAVMRLEAYGVGRVVADHGNFDSDQPAHPGCGWTWSVALHP